MCEQTEIQYLEGDVVWVKLGPCWWPGEVQDLAKLAPDLTSGLKKPPLAVVKFFQEDSYEYVKNLNNIYKYNCRKKHDFIKKGLDMYRSKNKEENNFMKKFPKDVSIAETKTGGDPDIIHNDVFAPEQKPNYSQFFGTPSPKKSPKTPNSRGRPSVNNTPRSTPKSRNERFEITHPRFLGERNDYGVTILEQTTPSPKTSEYTCHICGYRATRLNVIMLHTKSHSNQTNNISPKGKKIKVSVKKERKGSKKTFSQTSSIDEDLALIRQGYQLSETSESGSDSDIDIKTKDIPKRKKTMKGPVTKKTKVDRSSTICSNLLADWNESDDDAEAGMSTIEKKDTPVEEKDESVIEMKTKEMKAPESKDAKVEAQENGKVSCFDFKEEDEEVLEKSPGRKIPRVIPQKRKSLETSDSDRRTDSESEIIPKGKGAKIKKSSAKAKPAEETKSPVKTKSNKDDLVLDDTFKSILEETAVPEVPSLEMLKVVKNFQERQPIKSPDKLEEGVEKSNGVLRKNIESMTETTSDFHPKKRFVRNFEDFEMFHNEQKIAEEKQGTSNLEVSKLKTQLMTKLTTEPVKEKTSKKESPRKETTKTPEKVVRENLIINEIIEDFSDPILELKELKEELTISPLIREMQEQVKKQLIEESRKTRRKSLGKTEEPIEVELEIKNVSQIVKNNSEPTLNETPFDISEESPKPHQNDTVNLPQEEPILESLKSTKIMDIPDICIDNTDHLSGLTTLAAVSDFVLEATNQTKEEKLEEPVDKESTKEVPDEVPVEETAVEDADGIPKVEEVRIPSKKVTTLASFSLDYSDSNDSLPMQKDVEKIETIETKEPVKIVEEIVEPLPEPEILDSEQQTNVTVPFGLIEEEVIQSKEIAEKTEQTVEHPQHTTLESEMAKLTDTHPDTEEIIQEQSQNTSSSKLLEILTETKPAAPGKKFILPPKGAGLQMVITGDKIVPRKFDSKTQKLVIKSATPGKTSDKPSKPIRILSEKIIKPEQVIIKPDADSSESVSVKKVTSKRTFQDVEDIDTFIISKAAKKTAADVQDIILTPKAEAKQAKGSARGSRSKPRIIEQTIIKAADVPASTESASTALLDDSMFDINSMPIVLTDQILTPESIENMPVVMSEQLIPVTVAGSSTPVISDKSTIPVKRGGTLQQIKLLNKTPKTTSQAEISKSTPTIVKNIMPKTLGKNQKVYQSSTKLLKTNPAVITQPGKPGKFIILPTTTTTSSSGGSKYTVGKRLAVKSSAAIGGSGGSSTTSKTKIISGLANEPTGNKIMIVTNNQGQQSRVLLTPAHQKMLAGKMSGTKITKAQTSQVKGNLIHPKSILTSKGTLLSSVSNTLVSPQKSAQIVTQMTSKGQILTSTSGQTLVTSEGQILTPLTSQQLKNLKDTPKGVRKVQSSGSRLILPDKSIETPTKGKLVMEGKTKTILIKGSQGQTLKKYSCATPEQKVYLGQKQLVSLTGQQATTSGKQVIVTSKKQVLKNEPKSLITKSGEKVNIQRMVKTPTRGIPKGIKSQLLSPAKSSTSAINAPPPLAPITASQKKSENLTEKSIVKETKDKTEPTTSEQKHLVIQDALGNQTTVTEGQILALPSETVDGQPQSYMLVTVDETGNLVPISNEALMSLDPSLALGDGNNVMIQIDGQAAGAQSTEPAVAEQKPTETTPVETTPTTEQVVSIDGQQVILDQSSISGEQQIVTSDGQQMIVTAGGEQEPCLDETYMVPEGSSETQTVACNINTGDSSQQLIITGDPESTQKFLASLSEGNADLSSLLTGTEGPVIINTDGQQILLNADSDNQILLMQTSTEEDMNQSAMFVTQQAMKNQDILAAALADTDVFQQDPDKLSVSQDLSKTTSAQSQLSPNNSLYPMNVGNVLETSLINSPIMTPLELPANKKVKQDLETTIMSQVPSSLELPITITDPNISQTVSQHVMLGNELQANLDLPISISDTISSIRSSEMNSPSFVYSLPTLEDNAEIELKTSLTETSSSPTPGPMSMPLLTEDPDIAGRTAETRIEVANESVIEKESEEPELVPETEQVPVSETEPAVTPKDKVVESSDVTVPVSAVIPEDEGEEKSFTSIQNESVAEMTQKITNELEIEIEEELGLQSSDICDSLSEPPPGMFDNSCLSDDTYLNNKQVHPSDIPLPPEPPLPSEAPPLPLGDVPLPPNPPLPLEPPPEPENPPLPPEIPLPSDIPLPPEDPMPEEIPLPPELPTLPTSSENITTDYQEIPTSDLSNSELNSPRLDIDETSCEIPIQPDIVTSLSETNMATHFDLDCDSRKRECDEVMDETEASKRTKLTTCD